MLCGLNEFWRNFQKLIKYQTENYTNSSFLPEWLLICPFISNSNAILYFYTKTGERKWVTKCHENNIKQPYDQTRSPPCENRKSEIENWLWFCFIINNDIFQKYGYGLLFTESGESFTITYNALWYLFQKNIYIYLNIADWYFQDFQNKIMNFREFTRFPQNM